MKHGMKIVLGVAAGTILLGLATPFVWADGGAACKGGGHALGTTRHDMSGHGGRTSHVLRSLLKHQQDLGLTDDQVTKLKALALDQDRAKIRAQANVQVATRELRALVTDDKTELSVIEAKIKERELFEATLSFMQIKATRDLYTLLTPEQREKQKTLRHQMQQTHRARMFSSQELGQGMDTPDLESLTEGTTSLTEPMPRDAESSLQTS